MIIFWNNKGGGGSGAASIDPGVANVRAGVSYEINGQDKIGTYSLNSISTGASGGSVDAAIDGLATYLEQIPGLTVLTEWPAANQKLSYPSITITSGLPKRTPIQPEQLSVTAPDANNQVVQTLIVGDYDIPMQIDLWCRTKIERRQMLNAILDAFNAAEFSLGGAVSGLTLVLNSYFGISARYEIDTHQFRDDEKSAQTQERRAIISLLVNTREIAQRKMYAIVSTTVQSEIAGPADAGDETNQI